MFKEILHITHGYFIWVKYKLRFRINQYKVTLVLTGEDSEIDYFALVHLEAFVKRKVAKKAVILVTDRKYPEWINSTFTFPFEIEIGCVEEEEILSLYGYYCFEDYFDNIVFTYTKCPRDNLLHRVLRETDVNAEEAVCLGHYRLRNVPPKV